MPAVERIERYELLGELAVGGMATIYLGRQRGPFGFSRAVAIKSMHPQFAKDEGFRAMFLDEATLTARIRHPNVVPTLDIVSSESKLLLVMEYVDGDSLASLIRAAAKRQMPIPPAIAVAILCDALHGLHAAHELVDDQGQPLGVVHRDVSPQNIHVGSDGMGRILDFGIAKAASRRYATEANGIKGKIAYMAPEHLFGEPVDRRSDVFAAGIVAWETLTSRRLFSSALSEAELVKKITESTIPPPSSVSSSPLPAEVDAVVLKALAKKPEDRWPTAEEMARALAEALPPAPRAAVIAFVRDLAGAELTARSKRLRETAAATLEPEAKIVADLLTEKVTHPPMMTGALGWKRARRLIAVLAILGAAGVVAGGAFAVGRRSASPPGTPAARTTAAPASVPATPAPESAPSSAESVSVPPEPDRSAGAPLPSARPRPASTKPPARGRVDCRVKFTVDANGDRHYKPECVE